MKNAFLPIQEEEEKKKVKTGPWSNERRPAMFVSHSLFRPIQQQMGNTTMTNQEKYKKKKNLLLLLLLLLDFLSMGTDAGSLSIQQQQQQQRTKQKPGSSTHRR